MHKLAPMSQIRLAVDKLVEQLSELIVLPTYLNQKLNIILCSEHAIDEHACNLASDGVLGNPKRHFSRNSIWQKMQKIMIYPIQILPMLPGIIQPLGSYLRKLAGSNKTRRFEWIRR